MESKSKVVTLDYSEVVRKEIELLASESDAEFTFRFLHRDDIKLGHLKVLSQLTIAPEVSDLAYQARWDELFATPLQDHYRVVVILDKALNTIVGSGTLFIEKKFLRQCGVCGHIEDIAVDSGYRGKKLGIRLIKMLKEVSQLHNCYKIVLDCSDKNVPFYEAVS